MVKIDKFPWSTESLAILYVAYMNGSFAAYPRELTLEEFIKTLLDEVAGYHSSWIMTVDGKDLAFMFSLIIDGILEPHVEIFPDSAARDIIEGYKVFFASIREDTKIKAVLLRCFEETRSVYDHFVKVGTIQFLRSCPVPDSNRTELQYVMLNT